MVAACLWFGPQGSTVVALLTALAEPGYTTFGKLSIVCCNVAGVRAPLLHDAQQLRRDGATAPPCYFSHSQLLQRVCCAARDFSLQRTTRYAVQQWAPLEAQKVH